MRSLQSTVMSTYRKALLTSNSPLVLRLKMPKLTWTVANWMVISSLALLFCSPRNHPRPLGTRSVCPLLPHCRPKIKISATAAMMTGIETGTGGTKIGLPPGGKTRLCPHPPDANPRHLAAAESPLHGAVEEVEVVAVALSPRGAAPAPAPRLPPPAAEPPPAPALPSPRLLPPQPAAPLPLPSAPAPQLSPALAHPCAAPALLLPDLLLPAPRAAPVPALRL
mmetsp:Transcript_35992/g.49973  ORF Transcript_35992/g.49973 Transcript_35992/m.49973 type:complete len:223 (-) Transcript_35992:584-1252(-)